MRRAHSAWRAARQAGRRHADRDTGARPCSRPEVRCRRAASNELGQPIGFAGARLAAAAAPPRDAADGPLLPSRAARSGAPRRGALRRQRARRRRAALDLSAVRTVRRPRRLSRLDGRDLPRRRSALLRDRRRGDRPRRSASRAISASIPPRARSRSATCASRRCCSARRRRPRRCILMMRHAFALGYRRYEWKCDALNAPSRAAARRLGLSLRGHLPPGHRSYKGRNRDTAWFAAIDREWPALARGLRALARSRQLRRRRPAARAA